MRFFIDTANVEDIRKANDLGVICGVTTNPSLIAKEGLDFKEVIKEITSIVDGPISGEVKPTTLDFEGMMKEAREIKEKMIADAKSEAQAQGEKMIESAKATIESEKNAAMAELKNQVSSLSLEIAETLLKGELSNKEAQTKLVEKMLGDAKLN